jgi:hypothetical protein
VEDLVFVFLAAFAVGWEDDFERDDFEDLEPEGCEAEASLPCSPF